MTLPPAVATVRSAVRRDLADVEPGSTVLVACSGGADSLALLSATVVEGERAGWRVVGATVDHGLQLDSAARADKVVAQMAALGVAETVSARVRVEAEGLGPEAAARRARYDVLDELAERFDAAVVVLGHTRDDQAETVLLGLARGSGARSLAGMRRRSGRYRRPLLDVSREQTLVACAAEGLEVWDDPHNADPAYTRARVRHAVLPVLETELGPGVAASLARTAEQLRVDTDYLDHLAEQQLAELLAVAGGVDRAAGELVVLPAEALAALPDAVRRRVLRLAALGAGAPGAELFHEHVLALDTLLTDWHGQQWIDLPGHLRGVRRDGLLRVVAAPGR